MLKHILKVPADHTMTNHEGIVYVGDENGEVSTSSEDHVKILKQHGFTFVRNEEIKVAPSPVDAAIAAIQSAPAKAPSPAPVAAAASKADKPKAAAAKGDKPATAAFTGTETKEEVMAMPFMRKKAWAVSKGAEFAVAPDGETLTRIIETLFSLKPIESF